jgi:hypothetical protein
MITTIISLIGAASWIPWIFKKLRKNKIEGKLISMYANFSKDKKRVIFLFKLSVISRNKDFFLKDIDLLIRFPSSDYLVSTSRNWRALIFNFGNPSHASFKKLNVPGNQFLNNLSVLKSDSPEVGYLSFVVNYDKDEPVEELNFVFKSFSGKEKILKFTKEDIKEEKMLFDDSIWLNVSSNDPLILKLIGEHQNENQQN